MCDQTPQRYYVCCFESYSIPTQKRYLTTNGQTTDSAHAARLFHSPCWAIKKGCEKVIALIEKNDFDYMSTTIRAIPVEATITTEM